jgi:hypothetical protein
LLALLPDRVVDAAVAGLFLSGSAYLWATSFRSEHLDGVDAARQGGRAPSFLQVCVTNAERSLM